MTKEEWQSMTYEECEEYLKDMTQEEIGDFLYRIYEDDLRKDEIVGYIIKLMLFILLVGIIAFLITKML